MQITHTDHKYPHKKRAKMSERKRGENAKCMAILIANAAQTKNNKRTQDKRQSLTFTASVWEKFVLFFSNGKNG